MKYRTKRNSPAVHQQGFSLLQLVLCLCVLGLIGGVGYYVYQQQSKTQITNFEECAAAGNPIMESYPEQCSVNGQTFVNDQQ